MSDDKSDGEDVRQDEQEGEEDKDADGNQDKTLTKSQKKKLKEKAKKEAARKEREEKGLDDVPAPPPPKTEPAPKKMSAAAKRAQDHLRKIKELELEAERQREQEEKEEAERLKQEEEKVQALKLEEQAKAKEKQERRKADKKKKDFKLPKEDGQEKVVVKEKKKHQRPAPKEVEQTPVAEKELIVDTVPQPEEKPTTEVAEQFESWEDEAEVAGHEQAPSKEEDHCPPPEAKVTVKQPSSKSESKNLTKEELKKATLRSPICCILGHVDTGKTKLLDKIRKTNVQDNEAGGITQQIGATFFPEDKLMEQCLKVDPNIRCRLPGLLIIDTPGHESFNNLRVRGSSLCDIAILVVDVMHGLEPQTKESLELLRKRKCPFVIALNKIDRMYGWVICDWEPAQRTFDKQPSCVLSEFADKSNRCLLELSQEGMNCNLWWKIPDSEVRKVVSVAPTSAHTGEGIPDLLYLLVRLTQEVITHGVVYSEELQCTILEVKVIEGLGTTIDVILVNGTLNEGDTIVVCGMNGPLISNIRALLTPQPLKELRVKGEYIHHKVIHAAMGIKLVATGLEDAVPGTSVLVANDCSEEELEGMKDTVMEDMHSIFQTVDRSGVGVYVMASTLGSLEALLQFLQDSKIPVFAVNIGTVHRSDVKKAVIMREKGHPEMSIILAFDIKVDPKAEEEAKIDGVRIMKADIIYHLFDEFTKFMEEVHAAKKAEKIGKAVFPCVLTIVPNFIFNTKDPIVVGVKVEGGTCRVGTPLVVADKGCLSIGKIASIEHNKKGVEVAKAGTEVAIKIVGDPSIMVGRHFDATNKLYSRVTRESIDCLKEYFRDELTKDDTKLLIHMKKLFSIV